MTTWCTWNLDFHKHSIDILLKKKFIIIIIIMINKGG